MRPVCKSIYIHTLRGKNSTILGNDYVLMMMVCETVEEREWITSEVLGTSSQKISHLMSPKFVWRVTDCIEHQEKKRINEEDDDDDQEEEIDAKITYHCQWVS